MGKHQQGARKGETAPLESTIWVLESWAGGQTKGKRALGGKNTQITLAKHASGSGFEKKGD